MALLLTVFLTVAFAATYALVAAMIGERAGDIRLALSGRPRRSAASDRAPVQAPASAIASRRLILA